MYVCPFVVFLLPWRFLVALDAVQVWWLLFAKYLVPRYLGMLVCIASSHVSSNNVGLDFWSEARCYH